MVCLPTLRPNWLRLWAKTKCNVPIRSHEDNVYHPLICHMLDVAAVAGLIWDSCLAPQIQKRLEGIFGAEARTQIVFWAGSHDLGKASPGFQKKDPVLAEASGLPLSINDLNRPHGFISTFWLNRELGPSSTVALLAQIAGGHHGVFPRFLDLQMGKDTLGNNTWSVARHKLLHEFADIVGFDLTKSVCDEIEIIDPALVPILAGCISVADWIGSNQDFFPCEAGDEDHCDISTEMYWRKAQERAQEALVKLGWLPAVTFAAEAPFESVFHGFSPNSLQAAAIDLIARQYSPYLMMIEAPMGKGKTETALYAADTAMCRGFGHGMYVAMPTQATGNAMFKRVLDGYLRSRGHKGKMNLQLVHGDALLARMDEVKEGEIPDFEPKGIGEGADVEAQSWFTARKRPLLAPFGIGTIDQSLLSVLQTRHWFVRLFGLAGKVVIFDEVHAYDAYMGTILERLLHWLAEVGCTVILLSATLPEARRTALVKAYSGRDDAPHVRYPRITLAKPWHYPMEQAEQKPVCEKVSMGKECGVHLHFLKTDNATMTEILEQRLEHGGCAAVVCNTVNRSIEIYKHLERTLHDVEVMLFHARTIRMWRRESEEEVLRRFGKGEKQEDGNYVNPHRPHRSVLVATQVIEQSLDLDFDLMVSEIAPVDLLLQRAGRMHRHYRQRPAGLEEPQFIVLCDAEPDGLPPESFGKGIERVYARYVLLRTWFTLRQREQIRIPTEMEALVEAVYGDNSTPFNEDWGVALEKAKGQMECGQGESRMAAARLLIGHPKRPDDLINDFNGQLVDDEDPQVHKTMRAATREGDPPITVVMIPTEMDLMDAPDLTEISTLMDRSVRLNHRGVLHALIEWGERPEQWIGKAHLSHAYLLRLNDNSQGYVGEYRIILDEKMGVLIEKRDGGENE